MADGFTTRACTKVTILPTEERREMVEREFEQERERERAAAPAAPTGETPTCALLSGRPKYRYSLQGDNYNYKAMRMTGLRLATSLGGNRESVGHTFGVIASINNPSDCYINVDTVLLVDGTPVGTRHGVTIKRGSTRDATMRVAITEPGSYDVCMAVTIVQAWHHEDGNIVKDYPPR